MALAVRTAVFRFEGRASTIRRWDIRFRVAAGAILSFGILAVPAWGLLPLAVATYGLLALAEARFRELVAVARGFAGFLIFFFVLGLVFEPTWGQAGFLALQAARLTLLLLLGQFLSLSATPSDVTEGIRWYLGWLGRRRAWAAANMASWALASVPHLLDQASGLLEAAQLRGLRLGRFPLRSLRLLTLGLLVRTIGQSLDQAAALEVRGFGLGVPPARLVARPQDAAALSLVAATVALSWLFGAILGP